MSTETLLVELLAEELPPKALKKLGEAFADGVAAGLASRDFLTADSKVTGLIAATSAFSGSLPKTSSRRRPNVSASMSPTAVMTRLSRAKTLRWKLTRSSRVMALTVSAVPSTSRP